jgi:CheY-like chemotaxis protein
MKKRVLLADTDPLAFDTVRTVAAGFGAEVLTAKDTETAFRTFIEKGPDLVIVDVLLPQKGGFDLFERIRHSVGGQETPLLLTTAVKGGRELREEALGGWNALEVLDKPLFEAELLRAFSRVFGASDGAKSSNILWAAVGEEGGFDRASFPLVVAHALRQSEPCALAVWQGKIKKLLSFSDGALAFAYSNRFTETLGRHLLTRGVVTEEGYDAAVKMAAADKIRIGEAFVKLKQADTDTIETHVRRNILDKVAETFTWQSGYYRFIPYKQPPAQIPGGPIGGDSILWMLVCEQMSINLVVESMKSQGEVRLTLERRGDKLPGRDILGSMAAEIPKLLAQCDGRTLKSVLETVDKKFFKPLYFLIICGFLAPDESTPPAVGPAMSLTERLAAETEKSLAWLTGRNHFQVLDVGVDCENADVLKAYQRRHDELVGGEGKEGSSERWLAARSSIAELLSRAEQALSDPQSRANYLASLEGEIERAGDSMDEVTAEAAFREGQHSLRQRMWLDAYDKFTRASMLNPNEPEYILYRGIALMHDDAGSGKKSHKEAGEILWEAHRAMPQAAEPLYQLGVLALNVGNERAAHDLLERALRAEPGHERAKRKLGAFSGKSGGDGFGKKLGTIFKR